MSDNLKKLWEQAKKTGFPLENKTIEILYQRGWKTYPSISYLDLEDNQKPRELDIKATKTFEIARVSEIPYRLYQLEITLMIECKQNQSGGWLFFPLISEERESRIQLTNFIRTIGNHSRFFRDDWEFIPFLRQLTLSPGLMKRKPLVSPETADTLTAVFSDYAYGIDTLKTLEETMTGVSLGFSGQKGRNDLYEALMQSTKAATYLFDNYVTTDYLQVSSMIYPQSKFDDSKAYHPLAFAIIIPLIVFDGVLCFWQGESNIPKEVERLLYHFTNRAPDYFSEYQVPIVSSTDFESFIVGIEKGIEQKVDLFVKKKNQIDEQLRIIIESRRHL